MEDPFKKYYKDIPSGTPKKRRYKEFIEHPNYNAKKRFYHVEPLILDAGNFEVILFMLVHHIKGKTSMYTCI